MALPCRHLGSILLTALVLAALPGCRSHKAEDGKSEPSKKTVAPKKKAPPPENAAAPNMDQRMYRAKKAMSFHIGDTWLIRPPRELNATGVVITRTIVSKQAPPAGTSAVPTTQPQEAQEMRESLPVTLAPLKPDQQRIAIDLVTGRATLRDRDGRIYPQQIDRAVVDKIHAALADRSWQVKPPAPAKGADPLYRYHMQAYNADYPFGETLDWAAPAAKPLPPALELMTGAFEVAHRYAYPLSQDVNLLR